MKPRNLDDKLKATVERLCTVFEANLRDLGLELDHHAEFITLLRQEDDSKVVGELGGNSMEIEWRE